MNEQKLYTFWERHAVDEGPFETEKGEQLNVISPGRRNTGSGPDYRGCILEVDGEVRTGEVEIHVCERDWKHHGHNGDASFDRVQLHFCLIPDSERVAPDQIRRTVHLTDPPDTPRRKQRNPRSKNWTATLCPAGQKLYRHPNKTSDALLKIEQFGRERIEQRSRMLIKRLKKNNRLTVFTELLLSCLGLYRNKQPAKELARNCRFHQLRRRLQKIDSDERAQKYGEGVLLKKAGLLRNRHAETQRGANLEWNLYRSSVDALLPENTSEKGSFTWNVRDVRPVNTPHRRIAGFVALFRRFLKEFSMSQLESFFLSRLKQLDTSNDPDQAPDFPSFLTVSVDDVPSYWNEHSLPDAHFDRPMGLIGEHRAGVIWVNGLLPYLFAIADRRGLSGITDKLWWICRNCTLSLGDSRTRAVASQLFGNGESEVPSTGLTDQGMHELHQGFCRYGPGGCEKCPVNDLLQDGN